MTESIPIAPLAQEQFALSRTMALSAAFHLFRSFDQYTQTASVYSTPFLSRPIWLENSHQYPVCFSKYRLEFSTCSARGTMGCSSIVHALLRSFVLAIPSVLLVPVLSLVAPLKN